MINHLEILIASIGVSLAGFSFAYAQGFFQLEQSKWTGGISLRDLFGAFLFFLGVHLVVVPASAFFAGNIPQGRIEGVQTQGWLAVYSMFFACAALFFYSAKLTDVETRISLKGSGHNSWARAFACGVFSLLLGYPLVMTVDQGVRIVQNAVFGGVPEEDQVAVQVLKLSLDYPVMSILMVIGVVCLVPVAEELLFRGYLQGWLRRSLRPWPAIIAASIIFAGFHFSMLQGWSNVGVLLSLFILSVILGLLYEKQRTLWAPIGLHMAFNCANVALLVYTEMHARISFWET